MISRFFDEMMKYRWGMWANELVNRNINFDFSSLDKFPLSSCYIGAAQHFESIVMYKVIAGYVRDVDNDLSSEELEGNLSLLIFFCFCLSRDSSNLEMCVRCSYRSQFPVEQFFISLSSPWPCCCLRSVVGCLFVVVVVFSVFSSP